MIRALKIMANRHNQLFASLYNTGNKVSMPFKKIVHLNKSRLLFLVKIIFRKPHRRLFRLYSRSLSPPFCDIQERSSEKAAVNDVKPPAIHGRMISAPTKSTFICTMIVFHLYIFILNHKFVGHDAETSAICGVDYAEN